METPKIDNESVATLAAIFYMTMGALNEVIPQDQLDENKLATVVTNKILTKCIGDE